MRTIELQGTLVLTRSDVVTLLDLDTCIEATAQAFRIHGEGSAPDPVVAGVHVANGGFHVKAGVLNLSRPYFAAKTNANFMNNRTQFGLPTIQGVIVLFDAERGTPLAVLDSIEISILRTGAATAVAARHLARPDAAVALVLGCGTQGRVQLRSISRVRTLREAWVWDLDPAAADRLAGDLRDELGFPITPVTDYRTVARRADVVVSCTPSTDFLLDLPDVAPGTFVAGVGADNPEKRELAPALLAGGTVVVDVLEQCEEIGDLHHAIASGMLTREHVAAELGAVEAGRAPGRTRDDEITVFDSTGMALQDVASAAVVYERARERGIGHTTGLNA